MFTKCNTPSKKSTIRILAILVSLSLAASFLTACAGADLHGYATGNFVITGETITLKSGAEYCFTKESILKIDDKTTQTFPAGNGLVAVTDVTITFSTMKIDGTFNGEACDVNLAGTATTVAGTPATTQVPAVTQVPPVTTAVTPIGMKTEPGLNGVTNCTEAEKFISGTGTPEDPYIYPLNWLHDMCEAGASGGTGAKFVEIAGPTALQMGEATGPARMVYVPDGTTFKGWTQGGWRYTTDAALLAQWKVEDFAADKLGLICGYEKALGIGHLPAFKWNGTAEIAAPELECSLTTAVSTTATAVAPATTEDWSAYPEIFKIQVNGQYYCGAKAAGTSYPTDAKLIETWQKSAGDGNYLHDAGNGGMSTNGFCKGTAPDGSTPWTMVLIKTSGVVTPVTFPLP